MAQMYCAWGYCVASLIFNYALCEVFATELLCSLRQNVPEVLGGREVQPAATTRNRGEVFLGLFCQAPPRLSSSEFGSSYIQSPHLVPSSHLRVSAWLWVS